MHMLVLEQGERQREREAQTDSTLNAELDVGSIS